MFTIGAFAIILDDQDHALLCHRRDMDMWNLPGGGVESGELPTETVVREVHEETGLDVTVERLVGVYGKPDKDEIVFAFACRVVGGQLATTSESDAHQYFQPQDLPDNTLPKHVERIQDALRAKRHPVFKRQTAPSTREHLRNLQREG